MVERELFVVISTFIDIFVVEIELVILSKHEISLELLLKNESIPVHPHQHTIFPAVLDWLFWIGTFDYCFYSKNNQSKKSHSKKILTGPHTPKTLLLSRLNYFG